MFTVIPVQRRIVRWGEREGPSGDIERSPLEDLHAFAAVVQVDQETGELQALRFLVVGEVTEFAEITKADLATDTYTLL